MESPSNSVRKGLTNAEFNKKTINFLFGEIFLISILTGIYWYSWWVFGGVLIGLIIFLTIKPLAIILSIFLSLGWAATGYFLGTLFNSQPASIVLALIGLLAGLGCHFSALNWIKDLDSINNSN